MVRQRRNTVTINATDQFTEQTSNVPRTPLRSRARLDMQLPWKLLSNKFAAAFLAVTALLGLILFTPAGQRSIAPLTKGSARSHLHLLVPASSSNKEFCQLLLSSIVLNYPAPILINWDAVEDKSNPFLMHRDKIEKVLEYLRQFPKEQDDDLVLMVDGFDVWFQLPPEVLIKRYFNVVNQQNAQIEAKYGAAIAAENDYRHTILFGPDKMCWPEEKGGRPACWAVPQSTLPNHAFGPSDDVQVEEAKNDPYHARPRWLNSGTIMGPARDLRELFEAVAARVRDFYQGDSDQYYFAKLWGFQEYARLQNEPNVTIPDDVKRPDLKAEVGDSHKIEFHVGLDYDSALFQTVGYYDPFISWLRFDGSLNKGLPEGTSIAEADDFELADDIKAARRPLAAMKPPEKSKVNDLTNAFFNYGDKLRLKEWPEMPLFTNVITKHVPPMIHFMMEKDYRIIWWERLWFTPFAKDLFRASATAINVPISSRKINGRRWANAEAPVVPLDPATTRGRRDGAWSDKGEWVTWDTLCEVHNDKIFGNANDAQYGEGG